MGEFPYSSVLPGARVSRENRGAAYRRRARVLEHGPRSGRLLALKLIGQLKQLGRAIKGVSKIEILYGTRATVIELASGRRTKTKAL